ncbi:MAG: hypothetical protein ACJA1E_002109 [Paracoccaceae bacterium]|jgi:hypothetical protein
MPYATGIQKEDTLSWVFYSGVLTMGLARACHQSLIQHPDFLPGLDFYISLETVTEIDLNFAKVTALRSLTESRSKGSGKLPKIALFAPTDVTFGMARMYETLLNQGDVASAEVFGDEQQCFDWLGLTDHAIAKLNKAGKAKLEKAQTD